MVAIRAASRGVPVTAAMMTQFATLTPDAQIEEAVQTLLRTSQREFPGRRCRMGGPLASSAAAISFAHSRSAAPEARVAEAMAADIPTISQRQCLEDAFRVLQEKSAPAVGVVDSGWTPDRLGHP